MRSYNSVPGRRLEHADPGDDDSAVLDEIDLAPENRRCVGIETDDKSGRDDEARAVQLPDAFEQVAARVLPFLAGDEAVFVRRLHTHEDMPELCRYLLDAYYGYIHWGATAKVKHLESEYPMSLPPASAAKSSGDRNITSTNYTTISSHSSLLDLTTVVKASQALASEIVLDKLLEKLMKW